LFAGDWTRTFHKIPKLADDLLAKAGAKRIVQPGLTDAAKGNMYGDFEDWLDHKLWPALQAGSSPPAEDVAIDFELSTDARATALRFDVQPATVKQNIKLTSGNEPEKFHLELSLPSDATYECGDYLAVLPQNSEEAVHAAMAHFNVPWDTVITIKGEGPSALPLNTPVPVAEILRSYVELSQPVTKKVSSS
jgi:cytochrome P450 / NADPH-cytochrome P450 reductase